MLEVVVRELRDTAVGRGRMHIVSERSHGSTDGRSVALLQGLEQRGDVGVDVAAAALVVAALRLVVTAMTAVAGRRRVVVARR